MEGFLRCRFGGAYILRGLYIEGLILEFYSNSVNCVLHHL